MSSLTKSTVVDELGLASYQMSLSINLAQRAFSALLKTCLSHHDLTIPKWSLLGMLYSSGTVRPVQAAKELGIKPPYIAKLINVLGEQGLLQEQTYEDDQRGKAISLTSAGREMVERVEAKLALCLDEQLADLKKDDLENYFLLTSYIAEHVKHHG